MKRCPVCIVELKSTLLVANLPAFSCPHCQGIWVSANEYMNWLTPNFITSANDIDLDQPFETPYPIVDNNKALICPECGHIMRRFQIMPNHSFHLDRCRNCNGIWFDEHEWQTLKEQGLHRHLNLFFTHGWQGKLRGKEMYARFDAMYLEVFGADDYQEIKKLKQWFAEHPNGNRLLAFLTDKEPYRG